MVCSQLGHSRRGNPRPNAARPAVREHLAEDSTPIHVRGSHPIYFGGAGRSRVGWPLHHAITATASIFSLSGPWTKRTMATDQIAGCEGIVLRSKGARDSIPVQPRIKIMRGPTHVGARVSFDLEIYRRLLAAIALDLIFNGLSFVE